jgi:hypothetical protein
MRPERLAQVTMVGSVISGLLCLCIVVNGFETISSADFAQVRNKAHVYIFKALGAGFFLVLCIVLAVAARKQSRSTTSHK